MRIAFITTLLLVATATAVRTDADFEDFYRRLLDKLLEKIQELIDKTENPSPKDLDRVSCIYGMNAFLRHGSSSWAISMLDSATKLQPGLLGGNLVDLGQYDQCISVKVEPTEGQPAEFSGQHCLVELHFTFPNNTITVNGETTSVKQLFGTDYLTLTIGHCYPSLCKPWVLEEALNQVLSAPDAALELFGLKYNVTAAIQPSDCNVQNGPTLDAIDWTVAGIFLVLLVLIFISTVLDYFHIKNQTTNREQTQTETIVVAFSLYTNVRKLLDTTAPPDAMLSIHGIKFISICWVVLAHRYRYIINQPVVNLLDFPDELKKLSKQILLAGPMSVDTFFLVSGLLNMYTFCTMREKNRRYTPFDVLHGYIHRYLRLTPAYLMMIGFTATWLYQLRGGPYWYRLVGTAKQNCRDNWWMNLIYLNNYLEPDNYCMMQSWYLAADMQMFWFSPFILYPLWRWPIYGMVEVALLTACSILSPILVSYFYEIKSPIPLTTDNVKSNREMAALYLPTHTKTVSYVIGIGAGYIFYLIKKQQIKFKPNLIVRCVGWLCAGGLMLYSVFGGYSIYQIDTEYSPAYSAFFIGFQRFFWALGLTWIIFMCILGYGGPINTFLSWRMFMPLGRLTYSVYLTHIAVILTSIGAGKTPIFFSDFDQVERFFGDLVMSFMAATILSMVLEAPLMNLEKLIFGGGSRKQRPARNERHSHAA